MLVLCATSQHLLAGLWRAGKLQGSQAFDNDANGHAAFAEFLQQHSAKPVYLIADAVEEDYRLETVPHTTGNAKRELIARKLNQFYRGLEYRTAHFIHQETEKRKDDSYLFAALNNADFLDEWIKVIELVKAQLVGVYLLPMLSQILVKQLKLSAPEILLCERLSSGLRQTYLHHGRVHMSRLVPNIPTNPYQLEQFYQSEIEKTRLYLSSQRLIARDTQLKYVLSSADDSTANLCQKMHKEQSIDCSNVNLSQLANDFYLPENLISQMPELLHMQFLASGHMVDNLAPEALTKEYEFNRFKKIIRFGTLGLAISGLMLALSIYVQGYNDQLSLNEAIQDTALQQHRYNEVAKNFPTAPISADRLKATVELDQTIKSYPKSPRRMMQVVSAALEQVPEIQLDRLRWVLSENINLVDEDKLIPVSANPLPANANLTAPADASLTNLAILKEVGFVTGEISGFTGDYRSALNSVNQLILKLKADPTVAAVEVLQEPVNVSSFVNLQGSTTDEQTAQSQPALFKLKVILKPSNANLVEESK